MSSFDSFCMWWSIAWGVVALSYGSNRALCWIVDKAFPIDNPSPAYLGPLMLQASFAAAELNQCAAVEWEDDR